MFASSKPTGSSLGSKNLTLLRADSDHQPKTQYKAVIKISLMKLSPQQWWKDGCEVALFT